MPAIDILRPAMLLAGWTVLMTVWMIVSRVQAMSKAGIDAQQAQNTSRLTDLLPHEVQKIANNYNHLFEQPTLFYAVALMIAVLGHADPMHVNCAWAFAILRIVHSCVQTTVDVVMVRFTFFVLSWLALATMILRELIAAF